MRIILDGPPLLVGIVVLLWIGFGLGWLAGRRSRKVRK